MPQPDAAPVVHAAHALDLGVSTDGILTAEVAPLRARALRFRSKKGGTPQGRSGPRVHPEFDESMPGEYPVHLKEAIADMPTAPGVYIFHGEEGGLPLYIGKSVHLRNRVLSHLRNAQEARLWRQTRRISHQRTAGEIGALLLEARLIKEQQPLFNQKLRRNRQLCSLRLRHGQLEVVHAKEVNFATEDRLFGLFGSRRSALDALAQLADEHRLCLGALGLERLTLGKPCFRQMVNRCGGVCCGAESRQAHDARLSCALAALQVVCWPYSGAIGLVETCLQDPVFRQIHVVRNWCYLGTAPDEEEARALDSVAAGFDADSYKILCKPILCRQVDIIELSATDKGLSDGG